MKKTSGDILDAHAGSSGKDQGKQFDSALKSAYENLHKLGSAPDKVKLRGLMVLQDVTFRIFAKAMLNEEKAFQAWALFWEVYHRRREVEMKADAVDSYRIPCPPKGTRCRYPILDIERTERV